jgi:hypothetical protein
MLLLFCFQVATIVHVFGGGGGGGGGGNYLIRDILKITLLV